MSLVRNGKEVLCDGPGVDACGCSARAPLPVALNSRLSLKAARSPIADWVFVVDGTSVRHYCPVCARAYSYLLDSQSNATDALPTLLREA